MSDITCPFCGETEFDKVGLKSHLQRGYCEPFESLERLPRLFTPHVVDADE